MKREPPRQPPEKSGAGNAHIRAVTPGAKQPTSAEDAHRLLNDPAFQRAFSTSREYAVQQIERLVLNSPDAVEFERELCRTLRTLANVKRVIGLALQNQQLREHDFRPTTPPQDAA